MTQSATRQVTYTLASRTSGVPGLEKFASSLERIRSVQDQIKRQGDVVAGLRDKTATVRLKFETASINAELARIQNRSVNVNIKFGNMQAAQNDVKTFKNLLASVGSNMQYTVTVKTTALSLLNTQFDLQIVKLQSLISQLRALGSAGGAGGGRGGAGTGSISAANRALLGELDALNNKWQRGDILAADFGRELTALQAKLRTAAAGATAGSAEFARLDTGLTRLTTSLRSINTDAFQKLRTDAGAMRAAFDSATAGVARNSSQFQAAAGSYSAASAQIIARLQALSSSGRLTTTQLGQVNRELQRLAREANTIGGSINHAGLSGSVVNSFGMLGGQFGALAFQGVAVVTMFRSIQAAAGGAGLALGAIAAGVLVAGGAFVSLGATGLREIQKTQHGLNVLQANGIKDLDAMEQKVHSLKTSLGGVGDSFAKSDLTESLADTVKAGLSADESLVLMATSARLAAAENINLNDATGLLLKNIRQYGGTVADAARTGDMLAKAGNLAAGTANDLSVGLGIVGTTGKQAGIEMYDLLGQLTELDNKGMNAADVGANGLRAAIAALGDPTEKARGILKGLGIEINDVDGKARPAGDIMVDLGTKLRGMGIVADKTTGELSGNGEALRTVAGIMDNRAAAAVLGLTGDWKKYSEEIKNSKGELENYATIMQQGLGPALKGLKTAWADAGGTFAKSFVGPMTGFLGTLTKIVKELDNLLAKVGEAKDTKEINLSLKINADDDLTTFILKFLMGTGEAVKGIAGAAISLPFVPPQELIDTAMERSRLRGGQTGPVRATMIRNDLVTNGLLPQLAGDAAKAQLKEIQANVPKYEKLWDDFIDAAVRKARAGGDLLSTNVNTGPQPFVGPGPLRPGQTRAPAPGLVASEYTSLITAIGMAGRTMLNDFGVGGKDYKHDGELSATAVHNGLDYAAPRGTPVLAAFSGALSVREDKKNGKLFELADAAGNKLMGLHLDAFSQEMRLALAKGAKSILVSRGQTIGYVGNTGTTAGKTPHLHLMGYAAGSNTPVDPRTIPFAGGPGAQSASDLAADAKAATPAVTKSFETYIVEARRILAAVSKYAATGSSPDPDKWRKATATLAKFKDQSDVTAQAIEWASSETKKAGTEVGKYGQTFDGLKKKLDIAGQLNQMGRPAAEVTKHLQDIKKSAEQAAAAEGKRFGVTNGGTEKYRQLSLLAADAAKQLKDIENKKPDLSPVQKEQQQLAEARAIETTTKFMRGKTAQQLLDIKNGGIQKEGDLERIKLAESEIKRRADLEDAASKKATQDAETRAKQAKQQAAQIAETARQGNIKLAEQQAATLDQMRENDLRKAGDNAAAKLTVEKRYADQTVTAQKAIADRRYSDAMGDAARGPAQLRAQAELIAKKDLDAAYLKADSDAKGRLETAQKAADDRVKAREKEQRDLRAKFAAERRDLDVQEAQATLTRTQELNRQELDAFKGTAAQRVTLLKRQAQDEYNAQEQAERANRDKAIREAQNAGGPNVGRKIDGIKQAYTDATGKAAATQADAGRKALEDQTKATQDAREGYSKLADSMRQKIAAGKVEAADLAAYLVGLKDVQAANDKLGLSQNKYVQVAQSTAAVLYQQGIDAQIASGAFKDLAEGHSLAGEASAKYLSSVEDVLAQMPGTVDGNEAYLKVLTDLAAQGYISASAIDAVTKAIKEQSDAAAIDAALREFGGVSSGTAQMRPNGLIVDGEDIYQTEEEIRNLGTTTDNTTQSFIDLGSIIDHIGDYSQEGLQDLIRLSGMAADKALELWKAWNEAHPIDISAQLDGIMQAQALLDKLEGATDPVQIQAITGDISTFLASDVGKLLPDSVRQGLLDGVEGAGEFKTLLSGLTADAVAAGLQDASTRTLNADKGPENRFKEFTDQIIGGDFDLSNPEVLKGLYEGLDLSVKAGELTIPQLEIIKLIVDSINAQPLNITGQDKDSAALESAIGAITSKIDEAQASYASGASDADAYNAALIEQEAALLRLLVNLDRVGPSGAAAAASVRLLLSATAASIDPAKRLAEELGTLADEKAVGLTTQGVSLIKNFQEGAIGIQEYTEEAVKLVTSYEQQAEAAERVGRSDLGAYYRGMAADLRDVGGEALEVAEKLLKLQATATGLESIGNGLSSIFNAFGLGDVGKLSSALGGVFKAGLNIQSSYKAIGPAFQKSFGAGLSAVGSFLGPVGEGINLVGQIGQAIMDLSPGFQAWKKDLLEVAEIQKKALGAGTGGFESPWAKQLQEDAAKREKLGNAGFWQQVWWGLTGSAPQVMKTESAKLLAELQTIFAGLGEGISSAMSSSMTDAFLKGDMADFAANFGKSFDQVVGKVVLQTMIEAAIQEGAVAQDLGELTQAIKDRRYNDIPSILARIKQHAGEAMAPIAALAPSLPGYGSGGGSGGSGGSEPTISPVDKRRRDELLYRYENATDPAEKERLRKELLGLDPSTGGGGTTTTISATPVKTETPDWAALNAGINRLADFGAQSDQIARMESETARMNRESAGVMAQAAGMMLLASQGRGSGTGPGNINF